MSWQQWPLNAISTGAAGLPVMPQNPTASTVMPTNTPYTPEQWRQMQQQNWQQWAQWQHQYQQWHQQYGAEFQKSMSAMTPQVAVPNLPVTQVMPNTSVPPPLPNQPAETKPPLPPEDAPQTNWQGGSKPISSYTTVPPNQPNNYNTSKEQGSNNWNRNNSNWQNQSNQWNQKSFTPNKNKSYDSTNKVNFQPASNKRPLNPPTDTSDVKRNRFEPPFNKTTRTDNEEWPDSEPVKSNTASLLTDEKMLEGEKKFIKQFADWESQFARWKAQNLNHPDKTMYREYEKKWIAWRTQLLERREQMKKKRLGKLSNLQTDIGVKSTTNENASLNQSANSDSQFLSFTKPPPYISGESKSPENTESAFLLSSLPKNEIPGLDLVKNDNAESRDVSTKKPDMEAISKGIVNILSDQKIMNMLSLVSQNQSINSSKSVDTVSAVNPVPASNNSVDGHSPHDPQNPILDDHSNQEKAIDSFSNMDEQTRTSFGGQYDRDYKSPFSTSEHSLRKDDLSQTDNFKNNISDNYNDSQFHRNYNYANKQEDLNAQSEPAGGGPSIDDYDRYDDPDNYNKESSQNSSNRNFESFNKNQDNYFMGSKTKMGKPIDSDLGPDDSNYYMRRDNFNKNTDVNIAQDNLDRNSDFNRGINNFNSGANNLNRGPANFNRGSDNCNRELDDNRQDNFNRGPNNFNRGPDNFSRDPDNFNTFNRGPDNFNRSSDNFNRGPDNFNRGGPVNSNRGGADIFNRGGGPDNFNRGGPDIYNRGGRDNFVSGGADNFNRRGPDNFNRGGPDNFNKGGADIFNKGSLDNFNKGGLDNFNKGGVDNFNRGGPDNFNRGGLNNFNRGGSETFNRGGPDDFNRRGSDDFNRRGPDDFNRGGADDFNRRGPDNFNRSEPNNFNRGPDNFNRGPDNFNRRDNFNKDVDHFNRNSDSFNKGQDNFNRGPNNFNRGQDIFNRGPDNFNKGPTFERNFSNTGQNESFNRYSEGASNLDVMKKVDDERYFDNSDQHSQHEKLFTRPGEGDSVAKDKMSSASLENSGDSSKLQAEEIWKPANVIDYDHKPPKTDEFDIIIETFYAFDYHHKPVNRIPYPDRPKWLANILCRFREFEPVIKRVIERFPERYDRRPPVHDNYRRYDYYPEERYSKMPREYDSRIVYESERYADDYYEKKGSRDDRYFPNKRGTSEHSRRSSERLVFDSKTSDSDRNWSSREEKSFSKSNEDELMREHNFEIENPFERNEQTSFRESETFPSTSKTNFSFKSDNVKKNVTLIEDILNLPGRFNRPPRIVIILRGPPGSGKTFLAKLIKDKEVENGGSPPRILSLDDYFMVEQEKEIEEEGRMVKVKEMVYEYEEAMESSYKSSLLKSFKKTITDGYFPFIIVDNINDKVKYFNEMWSFAKQNGFQVYTCQLELDIQTCTKRNTHGRSEVEIERCVMGWEQTPSHFSVLDATSLVQAGSICEVEMEEINSPPQNDYDSDSHNEDQVRSKWDTFDCSVDNLAKLDGTSKPLRSSGTMEDYLQLDDELFTKTVEPGKKRVRWADLEERKQQEKMRAIGFVVGQTNWDRMMDPTYGSSALTQTKYIERVRKY